MKKPKLQRPIHEILLTLVVVIMSCGLLALAVIDPSYREEFARIVELVIAAYLGSMMK